MLKLPFRDHHLLTMLSGYSEQNLPLDVFIRHYFRSNKALGSKDRAFITETAYGFICWQGLLDFLSKKSSWESRYEFYHQAFYEKYLNDQEIPLHVRMSFPESLFKLFVNSYGETKACELCLVSNERAPTSVRVNTLKTTRDEMLERWKANYEVIPCQFSPNGITFLEKINFLSMPEFQEGLFEVQDEGSQLLSDLLKVEPGKLVMDYCAGSGGKTLAFAQKMQGKGQIYLHDVRSHVLQEAKIRLRRAGIQNAQVVEAESPTLKKLKKKMDWVLVDAPCTGTGSMRRNPEMKWRFTEDTLTKLVGQQRIIFEKALSYLKPDGRIVYATCSILKEENEEQLEHFKKTYGLQVEGEIFKSLPTKDGMDGFFGVVLKK